MADVISRTVYYGSDGTGYRLSLIKDGSQTFDIHTDIELAQPGFTLNWLSAGAFDFNPVVGSAMTFTAILTEAQRQDIMTQIYSSDGEFNVYVLLEREFSAGVFKVEWAGLIHPEETTEVIDDGRIVCDFKASCGLAYLKNVDFRDANGDQYTGIMSVEELLRTILGKTPSFALLFDSTGTEPYLREIDVPVPFKTSVVDWDNTVAALDKWHIDVGSFYSTPPKTTFPSSFQRVPFERPAEFVPCYGVLKDVMSSLAMSLCLARGCFTVYSRESLANNPSPKLNEWFWVSGQPDPTNSTTATIERDLNSDNHWYFRKGAIRRGVYPYLGAGMSRINGGPELIWAAGQGWQADNDNVFYQGSGLPNPSVLHDFAGTSAMAGYSSIDNLAVSNSDNGGKLRFKTGGLLELSIENLQNQTRSVIFRFVLSISDGTNTWRLRRLVRTLSYDSQGNNAFIDIVGDSDDYHPKFYENYQWVQDNESTYNNAYVEYLIGGDATILEQGTSDQILQDDYTFVEFYSPPGSKLQSGSTNVLQSVLGTATERRDFIFRIDEIVETPSSTDGMVTGTSVTFGPWSLHVIEPDTVWNLYYNSSGTLQTPTTPPTGDSSLATDDSQKFAIAGAALWIGEGSQSDDKVFVTYSDAENGGEILDMGTTSVGSSSINLSTNARGRLYGLKNAGGLDINIQVEPRYDDTQKYDDSLAYATACGAKYYEDTMQGVNGSIFRTYGGSPYTLPIYPFNRISYQGLAGNTIEKFLVQTVQFQLQDTEQRVELHKIGAVSKPKPANTKEKNKNQDDVAVNPGLVGDNGISAIFSRSQSNQDTISVLEQDLDDNQLFTIFLGR